MEKETLQFLDSCFVTGNDMVIADPGVNHINIYEYGIPLQQQRRMVLTPEKGEYNMYSDSFKNFYMIKKEHDTYICGKSHTLSTSFSNCLHIHNSAAQATYDVDEKGSLLSVRFNPGQMERRLRAVKSVGKNTLNRLQSYAKNHSYPYIEDFNEPEIIDNIQYVDNTCLAGQVLDKCVVEHRFFYRTSNNDMYISVNDNDDSVIVVPLVESAALSCNKIIGFLICHELSLTYAKNAVKSI